MWIVGTVFSLFIFKSVFGQCPSNFVVHDKSCYHFSHGAATWPDALRFCSVELGGHLVEINNQMENDFILNNMKADGLWIGLNDRAVEGVWTWDNSNTTVSYSSWHPGEPNNSGGNGEVEDCAVATNNGWYDGSCSRSLYYVCEKEFEISEVVG